LKKQVEAIVNPWHVIFKYHKVDMDV